VVVMVVEVGYGGRKWWRNVCHGGERKREKRRMVFCDFLVFCEKMIE
jgi:hypothetical protein